LDRHGSIFLNLEKASKALELPRDRIRDNPSKGAPELSNADPSGPYEGAAMDRFSAVILVLVVVESSWAILCAVIGVDLFVYFAGLIAGSAMFWVPGVAEQKR
jgi:hypothetical protein